MNERPSPACENAREALGLRVDGELPTDAARELDAHLQACAACREVEGWMARVDRLAAAEPDPGVTVAHLAELENRILHGLPASPRRPWWRRFALPALVPSAALVMFVFLLVRDTTPDALQEAPLRREIARDVSTTAEQDELVTELTAESDDGLVVRGGRAEEIPGQQPMPVASKRGDAGEVTISPLADADLPAASPSIRIGQEEVQVLSPRELGDASKLAVEAVEEAVRRQAPPEDLLLAALRGYRERRDAESANYLLRQLAAAQVVDRLQSGAEQERKAQGNFTRERMEKSSPAAPEPAADAFEAQPNDSMIRVALSQWLLSPARSEADSLRIREVRFLLEEPE